MPGPILRWLDATPLYLVGAILLALMLAAFMACYRGRIYLERRCKSEHEHKPHSDYGGYVVSAVLGLLALLLGFTFSLAIERFEERRELVISDANAIGTAYLRAQLLNAPHRGRLSRLLVEYIDTEIALAKTNYAETGPLIAKDNVLLTDIWAATAAAFDAVKPAPFGNALIDSMNAMIDLDASRRAAHEARVPAEVFVVLLVYLVGTAGVLGYVIAGDRDRIAAGFLLVLLSMSLLLIIDIDRPTSGGVREGQEPMEELRSSLANQPPGVFDRWRGDVLRH